MYYSINTLHVCVYVCVHVCMCVYMRVYVYVCMCVCMYVYMCGGQCFSTLCWSAPPRGDPWATAISRLTLTTVTRLDSVYTKPRMLPDVSFHLACTNLVPLLGSYKPLRSNHPHLRQTQL